MVFKVMTSYAVELLALVAGVFLLIKVAREEGVRRILGRVVAWFVVIASILLLVFTTLYSFSYCQAGKFSPYKKGWKKHGWKGGEKGFMMEKGMGPMMGGKKGCPMMEMMRGPAEEEEGEGEQ